MAFKLPDQDILRVRIVFSLMLMGLCFLSFMLWRTQVAHGHTFEENLEKQSIRRVRLPGIRGQVFDRNGFSIADNRPGYSIAIYLEELRQPGPWSVTVDKVMAVIGDLSGVLGVPPRIDRSDVEAHIRKRLPLPLLAWRDIGPETLARWAEMGAQFPGVDLYTEAIRTYPEAGHLAHVIGYVGRANIAQEEEEPFHYYLPDMTGKFGIEKSYDHLLKGEAGGMLVRVDVSGYRREDQELTALTREPKAGHDLQLSIDRRLQHLAREALGDVSGAVVVIDPRNGDVLAMVSAPSFNPNAFVPRLSSALWDVLLNHPDKPLFDRAISGSYAPGSTYKPIVAIASMENAKSTPLTEFECSGYIELGGINFHCAHKRAHGSLDLEHALTYSCNVYFYKLGLKMGYEPIFYMSHALNLGMKTGIGLAHEGSGNLPDDGWMRRVNGHGWRAGDTVNMSIGQGALTVTPLQMAMVTATIANGGTLYKPRLVAGIRAPKEKSFEPVESVVLNRMNWNVETIQVIQNGMRQVVNSPRGTAHSADMRQVAIAGKTGTAEYGPKGEKKYRGWMIAYAPFAAPRYAVAMVMDNADSGGAIVGPKIKHFMEGAFGISEDDGGKG